MNCANSGRPIDTCTCGYCTPEEVMDKKEIYRQVNKMFRQEGKPRISKKKFVTILSSMESKGVIETIGDQCFVKGGEPDIKTVYGG